MRKEQFEAVKDAINTVEKDIKQALDLDCISREVGISKYHLHRLFKSITGKSLISYVRERRLSLSLQELINTDLNIIDISHEYQFEHEQSYIRAFKQMFQITPAQYRKQIYEVNIEQKIDSNHLHNMGQGILIKPNMRMKPCFYIQGIKAEIVHEKNLVDKDTNKLAEEFEMNYLPYIENKVDENIYIGYVIYSEHSDYSNYYVPSTEVSCMKQVDPPLVAYEIPTQEYAVFRYVGFHSPYEVTYATLESLYDYIDGWKMDTSYVQTQWYHFERMDLNICSETYCEMDIYVPIKAI